MVAIKPGISSQKALPLTQAKAIVWICYVPQWPMCERLSPHLGTIRKWWDGDLLGGILARGAHPWRRQDHSPSLYLFLGATMRWMALLCHAFLPHAFPNQRPKSNTPKWAWTKTSNESKQTFPLISWLYWVLWYSKESRLTQWIT
jgi:hypothetical protein